MSKRIKLIDKKNIQKPLLNKDNNIHKIEAKNKRTLISTCFKWAHGLSGNDYRVETLPKSYLIVIGIILQTLKIDRTIITCIK